MNTSRDAFERAFVTTSYLLDRRDEDLLEPLAEPGPEATQVARGLGRPEREARARILAAEAAKIVRSLEGLQLR